MTLDDTIKSYINEQSKKYKYIRIKEKIKTDNDEYWDALTVVEIISKKGNKTVLQSIDGEKATIDLNKIKYEKL